MFVNYIIVLAAILEHTPLETVYIYFDTATYDEIERDVKVLEISMVWLCVYIK